MRKLILNLVPMISSVTSLGSVGLMMIPNIPLWFIILLPTIVFIVGSILVCLTLRQEDREDSELCNNIMFLMAIPLLINSFFIFWIKLILFHDIPEFPWWCVVINNIPSWIILSCFK